MADWSDLPQDLVVCICQRMDSMQDFITFGAVCKTWSSAATKDNFTHQVPLLMMPDTEDNNSPFPGQCYNLIKGKVSRLNIPKTITQRRLMPWCRSSLGWLIIASSRFLTDDSRHIYLLHPFKHEEIVLPTFEFEFGFIKKFVLSSSPSLTSDYIVMVSTTWSDRKFAFWRPKDNGWTKISSELNNWESDTRSYDIAYYKGQFYIVERDGRVLVCDIDDPNKAAAKLVVSEMPNNLVSNDSVQQLYLVESGGALLLVFRLKNTSRNGFRVFEVPLSTGNWLDAKEVENLGNRALFLTLNNSSFSIEVSDYSGCKANCIYFARHLLSECTPTCTDLGIFDMKDGEVEPFTPKSCRVQQPYVWTQWTF
ncbi:putative F-box protein At3g25750 [Rosa rugosa]|uniref:putative F-box protein At3g25750 n=1 Tax=Rosa rugosa TaxID=74645 RepID=UPI002B40B652|nr:putative F-box protein At3g25750 [Rosa rugosa]